MLRGIEQRLERVFEGVFGRAFRTNVQPVELARKLAKEMDDHRSTSVRNVYVPNEYTIYLSPGDREQFEGYENSLVSELEEYLSEHAARENYALLTPPHILFETDEDLGVGEFGIATRMAQHGRRGEVDVPESAAPGATMIYKPQTQPTEAASLEELGVEREVAVLSWQGERRVLDKKRSVLGRSRDVDIQIEDPNVSRRHAEIVQEGSVYWLVDLGSTTARASRSARRRSPSRPSGNRTPVTLVASTTVAEVLLALKIAFLVLLYLFVIRVIRSAGRERQAPSQDSMILTPAAAAAAGLGRGSPRRKAVRLVVQRSPSLDEGDEFPLNSAPKTLGRGGQNDLVLSGDEFASARHARIELRGDGAWVQDLDSTNGTYVNGARVVGAQRVRGGDVLRVGETDLLLEED